jgi:tetraacyldisaccharide 4'-kinase
VRLPAPWLEWRREEEGPIARAALLPLVPVSWLYAGAAALHRGLAERGWLWRRRLPCRVVSVGSLLAGGSGKTPVAAWIAAGLRRRGHRVVLASRGVGRERSEELAVVSDGRRLRSDLAHAGDEPLLLAARAPRVPVIVARDRGVAGLRAVGTFGADVLVLDDGFQHHRLARDVEILTFDAGFGLGNGYVLPRGPLREPPRALGRADALFLLDGDGELPARDAELAQRLAPTALRVRADRRPTSVRPLAGPRRPQPEGLELLRGARVGMLTAIARPSHLRRVLESLGAAVVAERVFADHHRFRARDLRGLGRAARLWITTEKDALKIPPSWVKGAEIRVLDQELRVPESRAFFDRLEEWLRVR